MLIHTMKSSMAGFGKASEAFDAVDMRSTAHMFIVTMIDTSGVYRTPHPPNRCSHASRPSRSHSPAPYGRCA
jgi:hypothetical protein